MTAKTAVVVGGGAAGIFAALRAKSLTTNMQVIVLERSGKPLRKVLISGGGRCNVTHNCADMDKLLGSYPRGGFRLEPILSRFMPQDTVEWFRTRGVKLKTEKDGRMFPVTNRSETIADLLLKEAHKLGVEIRTGVRVDSLTHNRYGFKLKSTVGELQANKVLLATGGASKAVEWLKMFGHKIVPDIPSLFTFCCTDSLFADLPGISLPKVRLTLKTQPEYVAEGPMLFTHWGLSGPAVLKLSAFGARELAAHSYKADLVCDFVNRDKGLIEKRFLEQETRKQVSTTSPFDEIPKRFWKRLVQRAGISEKKRWEALSDTARDGLLTTLTNTTVKIDGKGVFKEEFVTAGGLPLSEIDVYSMESKRVSGLYVAGELLNVDGITGGFNFQNAWATGYIAGEGLAG